MSVFNKEITIRWCEPHIPISLHFISNNGCCDKDYFVLTGNTKKDGKINYSCQCGCGGWVTNGHPLADEAMEEYFEMCDRKEREE